MNLKDVFSKVTQKTLSLTEVDREISHQHEINVGVILDFFDGKIGIDQPVRWFYFSDYEDPSIHEGYFKVYDSRSNNPKRSPEWRMYYSGEILWEKGRQGDLLVLVRMKSTDEILGLIFEKESVWEKYAKILFSFQEEPDDRFHETLSEELSINELEFYKRNILIELGLDEFLPVVEDYLTLALKEFADFEERLEFPSTFIMSNFARKLSGTSDTQKPDYLLLKWLDTEEQLFRAMEDFIVKKRLDSGFSNTDDFIKYASGVLNRRKARMGYSLENHLEELFRLSKIQYARTPKIEGNKKPDFLFPSKIDYEDPSFPTHKLFVLGAKSTCKDRWRQVLNEADRIMFKHLCTLEPAISENQLNEMDKSHLRLVVPDRIQTTYSSYLRDRLLDVYEFIQLVKTNQRAK